MNICVIGSGITGLAVAKMLNKTHRVAVYEKSQEIGGIARTKEIEGIAYHTVGGHCFNSKNKEVLDFVFNDVLPMSRWHKIARDAKINFKGEVISYPIEFAIKEIATFNSDLAFQITKDFLSSEDKETDNLADWFEQKFGRTLAKEYFIPYNKKIWQQNPSTMSHTWIEGKLPLPNKKDFFNALINHSQDTMPHSTFYYPNTNCQNTFIDALASELNVQKGFEVSKIEKNGDLWVINGEYEFDLVISTMPLNILPFVFIDSPKEIKQQARKLKYNKVTSMLWKTKEIKPTWSYFPDEDTIFHRHIHIGNFFSPRKNYTITESMGEHSYEEMRMYGEKVDYLLEPIAYNQSDHAYVVYDQNHKQATKKIKEYMQSINLHTIGRFGEWEYYNMDICIESAMKLVKEIKANYGD